MSVDKESRVGRPRLLSADQIRELREFTLAHADLTVGELRREFGLHAGVKLSRSSVLKYLKEAGITRSRPSKDAPVKGSGSPTCRCWPAASPTSNLHNI